MTRKRRVFDIDMPSEEVVQPEPRIRTLERRGPMASAISENAEALKVRRNAVEAIREENDALAHEFVALREAGQVVEALPLEDVHTHLLVRDRLPGEDRELEELVTSIRDLGLSNPIRVLPRPDGDGFELVQGYRRLAAYKQLHQQEGEGAWGRIPALVLPGEIDISGLHRRMIDENVVRRDLSFAEMARAAQNYAADPGTDADDLPAAVAALFQSAPYSKRSYIRSFAYLLDELGGCLTFPAEVPRALGVALARHIKDRPELVGRIRIDLEACPDRSTQDELDILRRYAISDEPDTQNGDGPSGRKTSGSRGGVHEPRRRSTWLALPARSSVPPAWGDWR